MPSSRTMSDDTKALAGVRVLDLTQVMAGPFCAMQLCDMGADVIKVEPPEGDSTRRMSGAVGSDSHSFNAVNRGKRGIVLDLKSPLAREACVRLVRRADVVIENYRPGVMRRLGLDYETLAPESSGPDLRVDFRLRPDRSGCGEGRLRSRRTRRLGADVGDRRAWRRPVKVGVPITDLGAALFATNAILAALLFRSAHRTRPVHRHVSARRRRRVVGVGIDRVFQRRRSARADGVRASDERAVPGGALRRWIHHAGRRQRSAVRAPVRPARASRVAHRSRLRRRHEPREASRRHWRATSKP